MIKAWTEMVLPMLQRPNRVQVAALCYRPGADGGREVLLITSRDTGRWVIPKGWPIDGLSGPEIARQEAWEEAGVTDAEIDPKPVGQYHYAKVLETGLEVPVELQVYLTRVGSLAQTYPEAGERIRKWVPAAEAAELVDEPGLRDILREF